VRAPLFAVTGLALFAFWAVTRPTAEMTAAMQEWPQVLWFSATLMLLAVSVAAYGRMVGGVTVVRLATIGAAGAALASGANVFEDGFRIEAFFFVFITGTLVLDLALLGLVIAVLRSRSALAALHALVPGLALAGVLVFVVAGGPLMLTAWLIAAALAVLRWRRSVTIAPGSAP
jgi:hypothetical protein